MAGAGEVLQVGRAMACDAFFVLMSLRFFHFSGGESYLGLGFCNFIGFVVFVVGPLGQNNVHVTHFSFWCGFVFF